MEFLDLAPAHRAAGLVKLPGSKSISNRTLLLAALARGATVLTGVLESDDTRVMRGALGVAGEEIDGPSHLRVSGVAGASFPAKRTQIFLGNSGTSARSLAAVLA